MTGAAAGYTTTTTTGDKQVSKHRRPTRADRTKAAAWFLDRKAEGVPSVVTGHEAWTLTAGQVGREGDHSSPWPLMAVALRVARGQ